MATTGFAGIPAAAIDFFAALERDNTAEFWARERATYESAVRAPFLALLEATDPGAAWRVYRPRRDTRFSADKSPYKTFAGAVRQWPDGTGAFVQISAKGLLTGTGMPVLARDQLTRFRDAVADERSGPRLVEAAEAVRGRGLRVAHGYPEPLTTAPRGLARDHPRIEFLRWKGVECSIRFGAPDWLGTPAAAERIRSAWEDTRPVREWLAAEVGPSALSPEEIWGR